MQRLKFLTYNTDGHVAVVNLAHPPVNAVTETMYQEIRHLFGNTAEYLPDARAIVLTGGESKHFCGGSDLNGFAELTPENAPERMRTVREAFWAIYDCPLPVIAAVHGAALGTGLAIAASCDMVIAAEGAKIGLPEVAVGMMGGAKHASRLVPPALARLLHYTADPLPAEDFVAHGGVLKVVPRERLLDEATALAARMARHSPVALGFAKRSLNTIEYMDLKSGYEFEQGLSGELSAYPDAKEAVTAFFERREPKYTGWVND
ncbi:enoyl-CoA hydratase-related protein [Streptomyces sp. NPDC090052]|uniref:enoyl-CoA hydratase-related protein n=1 Tax=unclassified Streptomyces TaxID=2593676 RepID=UPI00224EF948|nr:MULTISPECIES: enoyl-CoA hydratase-related protein [unclassified Streptomyces]MCX4728818.1 enoyl-CoA hydratase-related protein [Streptomyces sp. NBC_01306]WSV08372.1 enoyl-CoA hydratase-related protein [Streptomyces sp. NBC_01020]WSX46458.1 enoyl-CoA hydratase-related protein [Streptomyces sp. NBC_00963]WSX65474.1 enoyl-CoA hydratase-related protein [Streptomyces sp. NBC_00932]